MGNRMTVLTLAAAGLMLAVSPPAPASERDVIITGAAVGALIGGSIAVQAHHGRVPVYIEIGVPPPRAYYYPAYPRYYAAPGYYRPHPVIIAPHYRFKPHHHYKHRYRHHQRRHSGYYAPRW